LKITGTGVPTAGAELGVDTKNERDTPPTEIVRDCIETVELDEQLPLAWAEIGPIADMKPSISATVTSNRVARL
jgi:hypothetical protein